MFLFLKKTWKIGLSILFGVAVLLFWGSVYPAHISYQSSSSFSCSMPTTGGNG